MELVIGTVILFVVVWIIVRLTMVRSGRGGKYHFKVRCGRCSEIIAGRINFYNEASRDYEGDKLVYFCRKVLMGAGPCYQQVEVTLKFDQNGKVLERQITGGEFVVE
ncbi:MAG: hypothetical protein AB1442_13970 [Nitrospirota bacterium]